MDPEIFPRLRVNLKTGALEATFSAFKLPNSDFMIFEAKVKTCRGPCPKVSMWIVVESIFLLEAMK